LPGKNHFNKLHPIRVQREFSPKGKIDHGVPSEISYFVKELSKYSFGHIVIPVYYIPAIQGPGTKRTGLGAGACYLDIEESRKRAEKFRFFGNELFRFRGGAKAGLHKAGKQEKVSFGVCRQTKPVRPKVNWGNFRFDIKCVYIFLNYLKESIPFHRAFIVFR
jgi:hypothetical protein